MTEGRNTADEGRDQDSESSVPPYDAPTEVFDAIRDTSNPVTGVPGDARVPGNEASAGTSSESSADDKAADGKPADESISDEPSAAAGPTAAGPATEEGAAAASATAASATGEPSVAGPTSAVGTTANAGPTTVDEAAVEPTAVDRSNAVDESPTVAHPVVPPTASEPAAATPPSNQLPTPPPRQPPPAESSADTSGPRPPWTRIAIVAGAAVAVLGLLYAADWVVSDDRVPRGVTVAGVAVGGKSHDDAEQILRTELGARAEQPVQVDVGDRSVEIVPAAAGLSVDWDATIDRAGSQPLNPITRLTSLFASREIGVVSTADDAALSTAIDGLRAETDREPTEGDVVFDGSAPIAIAPLPGRVLDATATRAVLEENWPSGSVAAVYDSTPVTVTQDAVDSAFADIAVPAVSAPVVVAGRGGVDATLPTDRIGEVVRFDPDGQGNLTPIYDTDVAIGVLAPQLVRTEVPPKDASFTVGGGTPTVVPGVMGELVEWRKTLEQLPALLSADGSRTTDAIYEPAPPALTTEGAQNLGVTEVIAEYTTGGFEYASGVNIGLTAQIVNGALVKPGETFSLNDYTGPRGTAQGFVESGIIDNGRPDRAVGGGISQFATTLYNASYFGGMEDTDHTEHSYYISRYPEAREATVFEGAIDLQFTNTSRTGVLIESFADSSSVTVRLWGTKTVDVESITGNRSNPTSPNTISLPAGSNCVPSGGGPGFTARDTRVISDAASGAELSRNTRTVKYDPIPIVRCVEPSRPGPSDE